MTETDIGNLALGFLGTTKTIASLDERTEEARAIKRHFDTDRDAVLAAFPWPFTTRFRDVELVEENPTIEWLYSYRKPVGAILCRRIVSGNANEASDQRIPFRVASDDTGELIYTNFPDAQMEFTWKIETVSRFSAKFVNAFARKLASSIAPQVMGGDPYKQGERNYALYLSDIASAADAALNEEQPAPDPEAEWIRVRA